MTLYVLATPIGNLSDVSPRARATLEAVSLVAAEDTRVAMKLLSHLGLSKPCVSCHRHNEDQRSGQIVERMLSEGIDVALTCDAGTPAISDPGRILVAAAWEVGIPVVPVCGPSAAVAALSASGFDAREYTFHGFPPREKKPLAALLLRAAESGVPVHVFYESPHRVVALAERVCETLPEARLAVCCDLTKLYEKIERGPCADVLARLRENPNVEKGEYCVVLEVAPREKEAAPAASPEALLLEGVMNGKSLDEAVQGVSAPRNELYRAKLRVSRFLDAQREEQP